MPFYTRILQSASLRTTPTFLLTAMELVTSFTLLLAAVLRAPSLANAAAVASDPCAAIAGQPYVVPSKALACLASFPYNETIKNNVMTNVERVTDFYSFEPFYKHSPPPFQESTVQIREEYARIRKTKYPVGFVGVICDAVSQIYICRRTMLLTVTCLIFPCY